MVQMKVSHLTALMSLTDEQKSTATSIFTDAVTAQSRLASVAVKVGDSAAIDQLAAAIGTVGGQLTAINAKADAAFYLILTVDQQSKLESMPFGHAPAKRRSWPVGPSRTATPLKPGHVRIGVA